MTSPGLGLAARVVLVLAVSVGTMAAEDPHHIWVEGQAATSSDVTVHNWYNSLDRDQLSSGGAISHYDNSKAGIATYAIEVPADGQYRFWVRTNPTGSRVAYRLGEGEWQPLDLSNAIERINVAADGGLDHRFIAWVDAGTLALTAGTHDLSFRFHGGNNNSGILDCFLLTTDEIWMPRGTGRPGGQAGAEEAGDFIWIEGDRAAERDVTRHGWYNSLDRSQFSSQSWISHYDGNKAGTASYEVDVDEAGEYRFWVRTNPVASGIAYRLGEGEWQTIDLSNSIERINVATDGGLDHRFIAWVDAGTLPLQPGTHRISFRFHGGSNNSGILDCFALIDDPNWVPRGVTKPGARSNQADEGYFAWDPPVWRPTLDPVFNLRHLNEEHAGVNGFVRRDGEGFVLGDDTPVRFWTVQASGLSGIPQARQEWWAQRLAAYGVNLVRAGGTNFFHQWSRGNREEFERRLDGYHSMIAALKSQGIYLYINHLFWNTNSSFHAPPEVFPGFEGDDQRALALLFFNPSAQDYYLDFIRELITTPNPYTGLSIARDPAVAFIEINNESSLLFHSFNPTRFVASERADIEQRFGDWLIDRYGSLPAALKAWGPNGHPHSIGMYSELGPDDLDAGRMRLYAAAHLTSADWAVNQRNHKRAGDQLRFMIEAQRAYYARMAKVLREAGAGQMISPSNWKTADGRLLGALEHYTYTANDVVASNDYFGTVHPRGGNPRFHRIEVDDRFRDRSALTDPESVSALQHQIYRGHPYMITENNWNRPNRFRAEYPLTVAAYASLAGIDGWLFFAKSDDAWDSTMRVWGINDTTVLGQFPGAALMYRRGDVAQAETVYHEPLAFDDLYAFKGQAMRPADGIDDPLYAKMLEQVQQGEGKPSMIDPLAFFVGQVTRSVDEQAEGAIVTDLSPYIDRQRKTVRSITDELTLDYGTGVLRINTPRAQGATGFLQQAGRIELDDIVIESDNEYGSILAISLDGEPLSRSRSILIQAATEDKTFGFTTSDAKDGMRTITRLGGYPLNVKPIEAQVSVKRRDLERATALDGNGVATDAPVETQSGQALRIRLPSEGLYTWVR